MKKTVVGILAHVDAGKTTLSEGMLYLSGMIRSLGRVDNKDAFLDTDDMERERGITIFSKQARMEYKDTKFVILDTPGHVDFSAEMERTLSVLDYAILVVSGADGVQGHTETLWKLLKTYKIPTFIFVNKMDQLGTDQEALMSELTLKLDGGCIDFTSDISDDFYDAVAMCREDMMEQYLDGGMIDKELIIDAISDRCVFPCFFGSALKMQGIKEFMDALDCYMREPVYGDQFGARVYKIARDQQGNRLTYLKITGGKLAVKTLLNEEKVNQIRLYSGERFETVTEGLSGDIVAITGPLLTKAGDGYGISESIVEPILVPVLSYRVFLPEGMDAMKFLPMIKQVEEEEPEINIVWEEESKQIFAQLMGDVQIDVIKRILLERFDVQVTFGNGNILYKETILNTVEGVGHFEPLRHYAEVHLLLEPGELGSGMQYHLNVSEDLLDKNWQRLILTHLEEKMHRGVLTGSELTDVSISVIAGKAHTKHTEGGDFRQATYRAVRQGLMQANSRLLEPYYSFVLTVPTENIGRAMADVERMYGKFDAPITEMDKSVLTGRCPVSTMRDYLKEVIAYTKGRGTLNCQLEGYDICHNEEEVIEKRHYDPERDFKNPTSSVFCAHGSGYNVPWNEVFDHMHVESPLTKKDEMAEMIAFSKQKMREETEKKSMDYFLGVEEVDAILSRASNANQKEKGPGHSFKKRNYQESYESVKSSSAKPKKLYEQTPYLLVDGYNVIFAWDDLNALASENMDAARGKLLDLLCNYQSIKKIEVICVFDAYRVIGHDTEFFDYNNIHVVYTKEAETADQYIEKFAHTHGQKYRITVVTSDGIEQIIIRGQGCALMSSREFYDEVIQSGKQFMNTYEENQKKDRVTLMDSVNLNEIIKEDL